MSINLNQLISEMTLDEKIGQLNQVGTSIYGGKAENYETLVRQGKVGSFLSIKNIEQANKLQKIALEETRLAIPLIFAEDVVHGFDTIFPIPLAESCSWNTTLVKKSAEIAALEAARAGIHWTFAPMLDVSRDPRWGRIAESFGEDTYLNTIFGKAKIQGFQGENSQKIADDHLAACAKHFIGYSACEAGKDYNTTDISDYKLANVYLPPFSEAIKTGVLSVMSAFNSLNGIPASLNKKMLYDVLRQKMKFSGILVSDWNALAETIIHGYTVDEEDAVEKAINATMDIDMSSLLYSQYLKTLIQKGKVSITQLDQAIYKILSLKKALGLFDQPYRSSPDKYKQLMNQYPKHRKIAQEIAEESIVLLKNTNNILPVTQNDKVGIVGPYISNKSAFLDTWACNGKADDIMTLAEASAYHSNIHILDQVYAKYIQNQSLDEADKNEIKSMDKVIIVIGEEATESGEAKSKANISVNQTQVQFIKQIANVNKQIITILHNGRPLIINEILPFSTAIIEAWHLGSATGNALLNIITGKTNPSGKLTCTIPKHIGQIPIYYNHFNTGRPFDPNKFNTSKYIDESIEPEYPFGYGLSYTQFQIVSTSLSKIEKNHWKIKVHIKNIGSFDGKEVIQLYIKKNGGQYIRPIKELRDFKKVFVKSGEIQTLDFDITLDTLAYFDEHYNKIVDFGVYDLLIGNSSVNAETNKIRIEVENNDSTK